MANTFAQQGWEVTVVNASRKMWEDDFGLDESLLEGVDPSIRVVELPLARADLETDIRTFDQERALHEARWVREWRERNTEMFPEPNFGGWRSLLEETVVDLHDESPFDLMLVSCVPYVLLAAALHLHHERGVPYAVDFRDGWSADVINGGDAFENDAEEAQWERRALESATSLWVVNDPIADHYRRRYPEMASRVHVVRNGYDEDSVPAPRTEASTRPLVFGYLGTINFKPDFVRAVLDAWQEARSTFPLLEDARWEWRGHLGAGPSRGTSPVLDLLVKAKDQGVSYLGPVPKAEVRSVYGQWDAITFMVIGGAMMTSGKIYECMATALPIVSVHQVEHDASTLLRGYPLWTGVKDIDHEHLVSAFGKAAEMAVTSSTDKRSQAAHYAARFERRALLSPAAAHLGEEFLRA